MILFLLSMSILSRNALVDSPGRLTNMAARPCGGRGGGGGASAKVSPEVVALKSPFGGGALRHFAESALLPFLFVPGLVGGAEEEEVGGA